MGFSMNRSRILAEPYCKQQYVVFKYFLFSVTFIRIGEGLFDLIGSTGGGMDVCMGVAIGSFIDFFVSSGLY